MPEITFRLSTALADRYKIERHLGEGGMATVSLAEDLKHKRKVAVKVLRPELAAVPNRLLRGITIAANLSHPNILPVLDSGSRGAASAVWAPINSITRCEHTLTYQPPVRDRAAASARVRG